jgi:hypothetical protein
MLRLVYAMPDALMHLESEQVAIHRPWATWVAFARDAVQVIELSRAAAAQIKELPKPDSKTAVEVPVSTAPAKLLTPIIKPAAAKKPISKTNVKKATGRTKSDSRKIVTSKNPVAKKPVAKKPATKKPATKKPATKKPATKTTK